MPTLFSHFLTFCKPPAVRALLIQCACFVVLMAILIGIKSWSGWALPLFAVLLLQGTLAAALSWLARLDAWWPPIQFVFPLAAAGALAVSLPPLLYLLVFIVLLGLYWSTFRTRVPYFPSHLPVWQQVAHLLPAQDPVRFIDIGSGLGGLVRHLAAERPDSEFSGIEIAPVPWLISRLRQRLRQGNSRFLLGDYNRLDFANYDVVFAFLSPAAMPALWAKVRAEMRPGTLLLSYEFPIPDVLPTFTTEPDRRNATIYGWHL